VLLTVDERTIARRIRGGKRPLLNAAADPVAEWKRIRDERAPLYAEVADVEFDTSHGPIQQTVEAVVAWARPGGEAPARREGAQPRRSDGTPGSTPEIEEDR
jgi:shikimate kinase